MSQKSHNLINYKIDVFKISKYFFLLLRGEIGGSASKTLEFDLSYMRKKVFLSDAFFV